MALLARKLAWLRTLLIAVVAWSVTALPLMAAAPQGAPAGEAGKGWVIPYTLVVLSIALGLTIVCRSANRGKERRHSEDDE